MRQFIPDPGNMFIYNNLAGFLTCFTSNAFPFLINSGLKIGFEAINETYSSGHCSGFSPDSLFTQSMDINCITKSNTKVNNIF